MELPPERDEQAKRQVIACLSEAFESLLGFSGAGVLRFQLGRILGKDMYEAFYEDPHSFYEALRRLFGSGAEPLMRLVASWLIENGLVNNLDPKEFVSLLKAGGERARIQLIRSFKFPGGGVGRR